MGVIHKVIQAFGFYGYPNSSGVSDGWYPRAQYPSLGNCDNKGYLSTAVLVLEHGWFIIIAFIIIIHLSKLPFTPI